MTRLIKNSHQPPQQQTLFETAPEPGESSAATPEEERRIALSRYLLTQWDKKPRSFDKRLIADLIEE